MEDIFEITTETRTLETLGEVAEQIQEVDSGMIQEWLQSLLPGLLGFALQIAMAVAVYVIGSRLIKICRKLLKKWLDKAEADLGVKQFLDALLKSFLYFVLVVIILTLFGVTAASVVAVIGSAGLALGLALQGSLSNFAGGVLILLMKPFQVGDYIKEDTHGNEGTVAEISIFYTKLLTVDRKSIVIPNGTLANSSLTNVTANSNRRLEMYFGISYDADLKLAKEVIRKQVEHDPDTLMGEEFQLFVSELAASEVKIGFRVWVKTEDFWPVKWRLTENIKLALDENQIEIPYQKIDLHMKQ